MKSQMLSLWNNFNIMNLIAIISAFLVPIKPLILIVGGAIIIDTILGIMRSIKQKDKITSNKMSRLISKMFLYQSCVILFFCIETYILHDIIAPITTIDLFLTKLVTFSLISVEITSMVENYEIISGVNIFTKIRAAVKRGSDLKNRIKELL